MPLIVLTASSILSVTSLSTLLGRGAGQTRVVTMMVGKSTFGKRSTPSCVNAKAPTTTSERMRTDAKTGRRTQSAASHCMTSPSVFSRRHSAPSTSWPTLLVATDSPASGRS